MPFLLIIISRDDINLRRGKAHCQVTETTKRNYQKYLVELNKTFSNDSHGLCQVFLLDHKWGCESNANQACQQ